MIRGIHYFSAEVKPKLMSSQGAALIILRRSLFLNLRYQCVGRAPADPELNTGLLVGEKYTI